MGDLNCNLLSEVVSNNSSHLLRECLCKSGPVDFP